MSHKLAIFFKTNLIHTSLIDLTRYFRISILCMKNISWNCWNIYLKCDLRNILATTSICNKNKKYRHLVYAEKWTLNMSCFCQNNRKVYFRASKAGELLTFLLLQNGPIHSTVNTNICWYVQYSYHFDLPFLQTLAVFCRTVFSFIFMKMRLLYWKYSVDRHCHLFRYIPFFVLVGTYIYPFLGSKKGMYRSKQKRICIGQDVIDGPHCTFWILFGTGEYFYPLTLLNSICFHQNFSIYFKWKRIEIRFFDTPAC